jgi:integrase
MPLKPFFRKHDNWWVVQLRQGRKRWQHKLCKGTPPKGKDTEQEAYELFNKLMADGTDNLPPPTRLRVTDLLRAFLHYSAQHNDEKTFAWYKMYLVNFDDLYGSLRPHQVTPQIVDAWLKTNTGWKGSRRCAVVALKRAFNWAWENGKLAKNPLRGYKKPPSRARERYLTPEERQKIFDNYPEGDPFRDFLFALENTACRPGEVASVTAAKVDLRTGVWEFDEHKTDDKTGAKRVVILTPEMIELTKRLIVKNPTGPLFRDTRGEPWNGNSIRCRFRRVREKLCLGNDVVAYLYRHATTTDLLESGVGLAQTCELLGHKSTEMVMKHYSKIRERREHLREQMMKIQQRPRTEKRA